MNSDTIPSFADAWDEYERRCARCERAYPRPGESLCDLCALVCRQPGPCKRECEACCEDPVERAMEALRS